MHIDRKYFTPFSKGSIVSGGGSLNGQVGSGFCIAIAISLMYSFRMILSLLFSNALSQDDNVHFSKM